MDDDPSVRGILRKLIESVGMKAKVHASAQDFLDGYDPDRPGCLIVDVRLPGMSGLELQKILVSRQASIPIIVITGHGSIPMAMEAMRWGATDFLEKPIESQRLFNAIRRALAKDSESRRRRALLRRTATALASLTSNPTFAIRGCLKT